MTIKDWLIKGMTEEMDYSQDVIEKVIAFQGEDMLKAVREYREVEISGFGTIFISPGKLRNHLRRAKIVLEKYLQQDPPDPLKIESQTEKVKFLESKC